MKKFQLLKFKRFYFLNFSAIGFLEIFYILFLNNSNPINGDILRLSSVIILISSILIALQYPVLILFQNWIYKSMIFYLSMISFLFCIGVLFHFSEHSIYSSLDLIESGIKSVILGQIFGGLFMFIILLLLNWKNKEDIF